MGGLKGQSFIFFHLAKGRVELFGRAQEGLTFFFQVSLPL